MGLERIILKIQNNLLGVVIRISDRFATFPGVNHETSMDILSF